jgi:hypothetical protein
VLLLLLLLLLLLNIIILLGALAQEAPSNRHEASAAPKPLMEDDGNFLTEHTA